MNEKPTVREMQVWREICGGLPMKSVAEVCGVRLDTARNDRRELKRKLGLRMGKTGEASTVDLVVAAWRIGL